MTLLVGIIGGILQLLLHPVEIDSAAVTPVTARGLQAVIAQQRGKVVLVNAWASWCAPCKEEIPALLKLKRKYEQKGLVVLLISADDPDDLESEVKPFLHKMEIDFQTFIGNDSSEEAFMRGMSDRWSGALPATFLYDTKGNLAELMIGGKTFGAFERAIRKLLPNRR